jgi:hypothetical protein
MPKVTDNDEYLRSSRSWRYNLEVNEVKTIKRIAREFINKMIDEGLNIAIMRCVFEESREIIEELKPSKS